MSPHQHAPETSPEHGSTAPPETSPEHGPTHPPETSPEHGSTAPPETSPEHGPTHPPDTSRKHASRKQATRKQAPEPSPGDWQSRLRAKGYRLTPQRELVLRAVEDLRHATPDEVLAQVRVQSGAVNISTVYRTLELLEELGLVRHAHLTDRAPTYHSTATPDHVHLVCRGCGRITEVAPNVIEPMTGTLHERYGFTTDVGHLTIFGTCRDCER